MASNCWQKQFGSLHDLNSFILDVAEFVLNKCITQEDSEMQGIQQVCYNFDYLENMDSKDIPKDAHILYWMVS